MAVRTPPSSDLEELGTPERIDRGADRGSSSLPEIDPVPHLDGGRRGRDRGRDCNSPAGSPLRARSTSPRSSTQFNDWVIANQRTSPLFVNFLDPLRNGIQTTYDQLVLLLSRLTWLGLISLAAAIAGLVAGWRLAVVAACGFLFMGVLGLWEPSVETLALIVFAVLIALVIGIPFGIWAGRRPSVERVIRPVPRCDADDPGLLLPGSGRPAVRHRRADGADRDGDLRHPARDPPDRASGSARSPRRRWRSGRSFGSTSNQTPATDPAAVGEAGDPARRQPDDHDGARHRRDRGVGGGRRPRVRSCSTASTT